MSKKIDLRARFEAEGVFWTALNPEKKFSANLSARDKVIELETAAQIVGPERLFPSAGDEATPDVVHGYTTVGDCTLIGLNDLGGVRILDGGTGQVLLTRRFRISACVIGLHLENESAPVLPAAWCGYAGLGDWLRPSTQISLTDEAVLIRHPTQIQSVVDFCVLPDKTRLQLRVASNLTFAPSGRHSASRDEPQILIEPVELSSLQSLSDMAYRFEDFLSLCLGTSARLRTFQLRDSAGKEGWLVRRDRGKAEKPDVQTWVRCDASQLGSAIATWFTNPEEWRPLEKLIYGSIRQSSLFVETEFLSLAQALESFHRLNDRTSLVESTLFRRVYNHLSEVINSTCEDSTLATRFVESIQHANEPSFRKRIESLISRVRPDRIQALLGDPEEFEQTLRQTRNFFTHFGIKGGSRVLTGTKELFLFNQKLHAFLRLLMLLHVGLTEDLVIDAVLHQSRKWR